MKYSPDQLSAMARAVLVNYPPYYSRSLHVDAVRAKEVVSLLTIRFGCSENYVLKQIEKIAGQFNTSYTSNRA